MPAKFSQFWDFSQTGLVFRAIESTAEKLWDHVYSHAMAFLGAFPNPLAMADAVIGLITGFMGIVITAPVSSVEQTFKAWAKWIGISNKLLTVDKAIELVFLPIHEFIRTVTFTSESNTVTFLLSAAARWVYRSVKKVILLRRLLGSHNEVEFVEVILNSYKRKFLLFRALGLLLGILAVAAIAALIVVSFGLGMSASTWALQFPLSQDSKRVVVRKMKFQVRVNERRGPDKQ